MTRGELLAQRRELRALLRAEQSLAEPDAFSLFLLREELGDVNARLRALRAAPQRAGTVHGAAALDRAQYSAWRTEDADGERSDCLAALADSRAVLTLRQEQLLTLCRRGLGVTEIARRLGLNKSTVSRTLARSRSRLRRAAEKKRTERMKREREEDGA